MAALSPLAAAKQLALATIDRLQKARPPETKLQRYYRVDIAAIDNKLDTLTDHRFLCVAACDVGEAKHMYAILELLVNGNTEAIAADGRLLVEVTAELTPETWTTSRGPAGDALFALMDREIYVVTLEHLAKKVGAL